MLEVLDLTYNNLDESTLPGNFFMMGEAASYYLHSMPASSDKASGTLRTSQCHVSLDSVM